MSQVHWLGRCPLGGRRVRRWTRSVDGDDRASPGAAPSRLLRKGGPESPAGDGIGEASRSRPLAEPPIGKSQPRGISSSDVEVQRRYNGSAAVQRDQDRFRRLSAGGAVRQHVGGGSIARTDLEHVVAQVHVVDRPRDDLVPVAARHSGLSQTRCPSFTLSACQVGHYAWAPSWLPALECACPGSAGSRPERKTHRNCTGYRSVSGAIKRLSPAAGRRRFAAGGAEMTDSGRCGRSRAPVYPPSSPPIPAAR